MVLAYMGKDDYVNGGYRMLSYLMFDKMGCCVVGVVVRNLLVLFLFGVLVCVMGVMMLLFVYEMFAFGASFVVAAAAFYAALLFLVVWCMFFGFLLYLFVF